MAPATSPSEKHDMHSAADHNEVVNARSTGQHLDDEESEFAEFSWDSDVITNLIALYLIYFASTWAMAVPAASIAFIMYEFPSDQSTTAWIGAGPSLCLCVISIFIGDVSDIFGRKSFLLVAATFGFVGMMVGGFATSVNMIIGGQVLNGVGLTLGYLSTPLLAEVVPKRYRAPIVGGGTTLAVLAGIAGQISQGAAMKHGLLGTNRGWRLGFYLGAGFFGLSLASLLVFYRPGPRPNPEGYSVKQRLYKVDWLGILLGTTSLVLILLGLQFGGQKYPWTSALVLCFLIIGGLLFVGLGIWEWKGASDGLFPSSLFEHPNYAITMALNFVEGMVIFSSQAFLPQITLSLLTKDFVMAAVYSLPNVAGSFIGVIGAAVVSVRTKEAKWVAVAGVAFLTLGSGLLAIMDPGINFAAWFFASTLVGAGIGSLGVIIPVISSLCTPNRYIATAVAVGASIRGLGGAVGLVIFTQIFTTKLSAGLPKKIGEVAIAQGVPPALVPGFIGAYLSQDPSLMEIPGVTQELLGMLELPVSQAYADSFRFIWYALIPFAVITLLVSLLLKTTKQQMTMQVASKVQARHNDHHSGAETKGIEEHHI
ncbi:hypothetical protein ACHAQA_006971 [Verticillium albo-atrum]